MSASTATTTSRAGHTCAALFDGAEPGVASRSPSTALWARRAIELVQGRKARSGRYVGRVDADEIARLAAPLAGAVGQADVTFEGAGWDHEAWRVETATGTWIVRVPKSAHHEVAAADRREVGVMALARSVAPAWVPDALVLDDVAGCVAYRRVPGVPVQSLVASGALGPADLARLGAVAGRIVAALAMLDPSSLAEVMPVEDGAREWIDDTRARVDAMQRALAADEADAVERFLAGPFPLDPPSGALVVVHGDLGGEHLFVDPGTLALTGVIDWSDAAIGDPAADLGRLLRDLGDVGFAAALDAFDAGDGDAGLRERLAARAQVYARCLALEDLEYALAHRPDLVAFERATLRRLFGLA